MNVRRSVSRSRAKRISIGSTELNFAISCASQIHIIAGRQCIVLYHAMELTRIEKAVATLNRGHPMAPRGPPVSSGIICNAAGILRPSLHSRIEIPVCGLLRGDTDPDST